MNRIRPVVAKSEFAGVSYVFGGYVRDVVMGRPPRDIDVVVLAPEGGTRLAQLISTALAGTDVVTYGRAPVAQCVVDGVPIECCTARRVDTAGDDPNLAALADEAAAMDFTVDALFQDIVSGSILDPGGTALADIRSGVIRTPRSAEASLSADPERLIRAIRLAAELGFVIDKEAAAYVSTHAHDVLRAGMGRVGDELVKLVRGPDPVRGIGLMEETGLLAVLLPEVAALRGLDQGTIHHAKDAYEHTLDVIGSVRAELVVRLAALLHDIGKPATRTASDTGVHFYGHEEVGAVMAAKRLRALRMPVRIRRRVCQLVRYHMSLAPKPTPRQVRRLRLRLEDDDLLLSLAHLRRADRLVHRSPDGTGIPDRIAAILAAAGPRQVPPSPLTGEEVMAAFGLGPGPEVGRLLRAAAELHAADPRLTKESILDSLRQKQP
jgi:poly(A) polymerase